MPKLGQHLYSCVSLSREKAAEIIRHWADLIIECSRTFKECVYLFVQPFPTENKNDALWVTIGSSENPQGEI